MSLVIPTMWNLDGSPSACPTPARRPSKTRFRQATRGMRGTRAVSLSVVYRPETGTAGMDDADLEGLGFFKKITKILPKPKTALAIATLGPAALLNKGVRKDVMNFAKSKPGQVAIAALSPIGAPALLLSKEGRSMLPGFNKIMGGGGGGGGEEAPAEVMPEGMPYPEGMMPPGYPGGMMPPPFTDKTRPYPSVMMPPQYQAGMPPYPGAIGNRAMIPPPWWRARPMLAPPSIMPVQPPPPPVASFPQQVPVSAPQPPPPPPPSYAYTPPPPPPTYYAPPPPQPMYSPGPQFAPGPVGFDQPGSFSPSASSFDPAMPMSDPGMMFQPDTGPMAYGDGTPIYDPEVLPPDPSAYPPDLMPPGMYGLGELPSGGGVPTWALLAALGALALMLRK